jgi:hypothetical protein
MRKILEGSAREPIKAKPNITGFNLRLDRVQKYEDEVISHRSAFQSNRSRLSRNPSQPLSKRSAAKGDTTVNGSILTIGSDFMENLHAQWSEREREKEGLRISLTKKEAEWNSEFDSMEGSQISDQMDVGEIKRALDILKKAHLLDNDSFLPQVNQIIKNPG